MEWEEDHELPTVCPMNTLFDGACCAQLEPEKVNFLFNMKENPNGNLSISVNLTTLSPALQSLTYFTWKLARAINTKNETLLLSQKFDPILSAQKGLQTIQLNPSLIFFNTSYTFQVAADTPVHSRTIIGTYELILSCPRAYILNSTNPIIHQRGYEINILLASTTITNCYTPTSPAI